MGECDDANVSEPWGEASGGVEVLEIFDRYDEPPPNVDDTEDNGVVATFIVDFGDQLVIE
jgi:hypothetical protein